jgi:signal transduction histidine kinase
MKIHIHRVPKRTRIFGRALSHEDYPSYRPFPSMPSPLFVDLAQSQMDLLAVSISRIKSISLYLPQENADTGQLEFVPAILHPHSERIFIAKDANSGEAPRLPRTLTRLPGFEHATSLIPGYPMVSSDSPGVGKVEEVMCDPASKTSALSVPLFQGRHTVGVLLIWSRSSEFEEDRHWSNLEREQISRAAQSLSLALSMDTERKILRMQSEKLKTQLSDALHQVKNPMQALRTYAKLLQRKLANSDINEFQGGSPQLMELTRHLVAQSDRAIDLMSPLDAIVEKLPSSKQPLALKPYNPPNMAQRTALAPWRTLTRRDQSIQKGEALMPLNKESTIDLSFTNGTIEFFRGEALQDPKESKTSNFIPDEESMEMAFVTDILDPILRNYEILASTDSIDLKLVMSDELPGVWINSRLLQEAVSNVLDNALKYVKLGSANNPKVTVEVQPHPSVPGVIIRISDNGPGISEEEQDDIFQRGYRGKRTISIPGSGIGLDISRSMLSRMGGDLTLIKSSPKGSIFEFVLYRNS